MPQQAIIRAFSTCVILWKELRDCDGYFNFAQWGTMLQEHFHGVIRGMSHGNDSLDNTIRSIARSHIIIDILNKQNNQKKRRTRYSVGGTHYDKQIHKAEYIFSVGPKEIVERLEKMSIYGNRQEFNDYFLTDFYSWVEIISTGSLRISCTDKHFHYGRRIISREITNSQDLKDEMKFTDEIKAIDVLLEEEEDEEEKEEEK